MFKGLAKVGQGVSKAFGTVDDVTGNVLSWAAHKIGEGAGAIGRYAERGLTSIGVPTMVAQNTADLAEISAQLFGPGTLGKAALLAAGVTKFRCAALGAVTKSTTSALEGRSIGMSWTDGWATRGYAYERYLENLFPGAKLPYGFKTFDFFEEGTAISAKTLDTNTLARIAKPELVRYKINGYINNMLDFTGDSRYRAFEAPDIISRELRLAIPANTSPVHMQQIMRSVDHGVDNGVKVTVTRVK